MDDDIDRLWKLLVDSVLAPMEEALEDAGGVEKKTFTRVYA